MRILFYLSFISLIACSTNSPTPKKKPDPVVCMPSQEFITTLEFLRAQKDFELNEKQSREIAHKVSIGCGGSAKRFIKITNLLVKAGIPSKEAIGTGLKFVAEDDKAIP